MRIRLVNLLLLVAVTAFVFNSCKKTTAQDEINLEQEYLSKYIAKYHPTVKPKPSGLYFIETKAGSTAVADTIKKGDLVKVYYKGYLMKDDPTSGIMDGTEFDNSGEFEPFAVSVGAGAVIAGWEEGLTYMKDSSEAKLVIPSKLAYSSTPQASVPAYSPLVFYIKVVKVYRTTDSLPTIQLLPKTLIKR